MRNIRGLSAARQEAFPVLLYRSGKSAIRHDTAALPAAYGNTAGALSRHEGALSPAASIISRRGHYFGTSIAGTERWAAACSIRPTTSSIRHFWLSFRDCTTSICRACIAHRRVSAAGAAYRLADSRTYWLGWGLRRDRKMRPWSRRLRRREPIGEWLLHISANNTLKYAIAAIPPGCFGFLRQKGSIRCCSRFDELLSAAVMIETISQRHAEFRLGISRQR